VGPVDSLGGAIPALGALDLALSDVMLSRSLTIYTFVDSRVVNPAFVAAMYKFVQNSY
jgi:hypothetical protein